MRRKCWLYGQLLGGWRLPADGVGLARMEFIVNDHIKIHPMALVHYDELDDEATRNRIAERTRGHDDKAEFFVDRLAYGIARIAAAWWPKPVIVRVSDFKTNEYAKLVGGKAFEAPEENPVIGWRVPDATTARGIGRASALNAVPSAASGTSSGSPTRSS